MGDDDDDDAELYFFEKPAHAVPLASARQHLENEKEDQAGHSSERTVEGQWLGFFRFSANRLLLHGAL